MPNQLAGLTTGNPEAEPVNHVVETALELLQKNFASNAAGLRSFFKIISKLAFLGEIHALGFLLLAQLEAISYDFRFAVLAVLAGSEVALLDGHLSLKHLGPLRNSFMPSRRHKRQTGAV